MRRALVRRRLDLSGVTMGVTAGVTHNVAPTEGGVPQKQRRGCHIPPFHISPSLFGAATRRSGLSACQLKSWRANGCIQAEVLPDPTAPKIATPV